MKTLYLVRHAKSSWGDPTLSDRDRPLNARGNQDAPKMAAYIATQISCPDAFFCSPAQRARETAAYFLHQFHRNPETLVIDRHLYHALPRDYETILGKADDRLNSIMIFAHNPGITDYANALGQARISNMPTCAIAAIDLAIDSWLETSFTRGKLRFFHRPKALPTE